MSATDARLQATGPGNRATTRRSKASIDGSLEFTGAATPTTDFLTARTGFVVLHPLKGVAGRPVEVEHVDGTVEKSNFPELVNPVQPFLDIRALTHEVMPGLQAAVRMEGDTFEMEDHRNWTDASFKTYVRPLALPWPYTLPSRRASDAVGQRHAGGRTLPAAKGRGGQAASRSNSARPAKRAAADRRRHAGRGDRTRHRSALDLLARPHRAMLHLPVRPARRSTVRSSWTAIACSCEQTGAECVLEVVVESVDAFDAELARVAATGAAKRVLRCRPSPCVRSAT